MADLSNHDCVSMPFQEDRIYLIINQLNLLHRVTKLEISLRPNFERVNANAVHAPFAVELVDRTVGRNEVGIKPAVGAMLLAALLEPPLRADGGGGRWRLKSKGAQQCSTAKTYWLCRTIRVIRVVKSSSMREDPGNFQISD